MTLTYDQENRIAAVHGPGLDTSYAYNGLNTRVSRTSSIEGSFSYKRDCVGVTAPLLSDGSLSQGRAQYTPGGSEHRTAGSSFRQSNYLGSTSHITDSQQTVTDTRSYDAFGNLVSSSGSSPTPFGFAGAVGYQADEDTGLQLLGNRYYDSSTGRFLTRDPIKDGRNWYGYTGNNPLKWIDPDGLDQTYPGTTIERPPPPSATRYPPMTRQPLPGKGGADVPRPGRSGPPAIGKLALILALLMATPDTDDFDNADMNCRGTPGHCLVHKGKCRLNTFKPAPSQSPIWRGLKRYRDGIRYDGLARTSDFTRGTTHMET